MKMHMAAVLAGSKKNIVIGTCMLIYRKLHQKPAIVIRKQAFISTLYFNFL